MMPRFQLLPAEVGFYDWFEKGAVTARDAASMLRQLLTDFVDVESRVLQIVELEHQGDFIVHETMSLLSKTFITPLEGDEIRALISSVDDVIDWIEATADRLVLYQIDRPAPEAVAMAELLERMTERIVEAMPLLRSRHTLPQVHARTIEINRLENEADRLLHKGLARLVRERGEWFEFVRWKEILETLEEATDKCEDVADVLQAVMMKNA
jgi:uncharacterized protein Yka (UPF0111/DUF47 family)